MILGVCSTGSSLKLAVFDGERFYRAQKRVFNQEKPLFPMINALLEKAGSVKPPKAGGRSPLRRVAAYCAVRGPGRFTGIRIGLTLGMVLEALAGARVYCATLFEIMAFQAFESAAYKKWAAAGVKPRLAVLMRAFKDEYFCQVFNGGGSSQRLCAAAEPQWLKAPEMKKYLSDLGPELFVIGDAEEDPSVYALAPACAVKAPAGISRIMSAYVIKAAMALKNSDASPLYLKPARYEMEERKRIAR